ncbi:hypothetical protein FHS42_000525 [Streptomyces zagrosensis]|uniref:Uncharacterized protein n=1 Tax=Streptomyces zagrosensis TaxID=1042984 RepID=A0A7W9Q687_9ACTN|nr:hypothetical protein [Streptomyces zagrosensis]
MRSVVVEASEEGAFFRERAPFLSSFLQFFLVFYGPFSSVAPGYCRAFPTISRVPAPRMQGGSVIARRVLSCVAFVGRESPHRGL